jgi:hypothetical protein
MPLVGFEPTIPAFERAEAFNAIDQRFSTYVRPRPGKFLFIRRGPGRHKFTRKHLFNFI